MKKLFCHCELLKDTAELGAQETEASAGRLTSLMANNIFFFAVDLPSILLIIGCLLLLLAIAVSVILYQSFRVDIVLLYRELFQPYSVKDGE